MSGINPKGRIFSYEVPRDEMLKRQERNPEKFDSDPAFVQLALPADAGELSSFRDVWDLSLNYVMGHGVVAPPHRRKLLETVARNVFSMFKAGGHSEQTDTFDLRVHYMSVVRQGIAGRHDSRKMVKERKYVDITRKKDRANEIKQRQLQTLPLSRLENLVFIYFEHKQEATRQELLNYLRLTGWRVSNRMLSRMLDKYTLSRSRGMYKAPLYRLIPQLAPQELKQGPIPRPVQVEPPKLADTKQKDEVTPRDENFLFWGDFERLMMMASPNNKYDVSDAKSMYVQGVASVQSETAGGQPPGTYRFAVHVFDNGTVKVNLGFRESPLKRTTLPDLVAAPVEAYLNEIIYWFVETFAQVPRDTFNPVIDGISTTGKLAQDYDLEASDDSGRRRELLSRITEKSMSTMMGIVPLATVDAPKDKVWEEEGLDMHAFYVPHTYDVLDDEIAARQEEKKKERTKVLKSSTAAYFKQHMDAWDLVLHPQHPLEDILEFDQFEFTSDTFVKLTNVKLRNVPGNPLYDKLAEKQSTTMRYAYVTVEKVREIQKILRIVPEIITEDIANLADPAVYQEVMEDRWNWVFYDQQGRTVGTDVTVPYYYASVFPDKVNVKWWWKTRRFSVLTKQTSRPGRTALADTVAAWYLIARLFMRNGPGMNGSLLKEDDLDLAAMLDDELGVVEDGDARKRGHERYSGAAKRPGKKDGTTCEPFNRVPNQADPYDYEAPCSNDPKTGENRIVLPDKFGNPCCFVRPDPLTDRWKAKTIKKYQQFGVTLPGLVMELLGLTEQPDMPEDTTAAYELDFDRKGRLTVNKKVATKLPVVTLERISSMHGLPITGTLRGQMTKPLDGKTLVKHLSWKLFLEKGLGHIENKNVDFYQGFLKQLSDKVPFPRHSTAARYERMLPVVAARVDTWLKAVTAPDGVKALPEETNAVFPEEIEWEPIAEPARARSPPAPPELPPGPSRSILELAPRARERQQRNRQARLYDDYLARRQQEAEELQRMTDERLRRERNEEERRRREVVRPQADNVEIF